MVPRKKIRISEINRANFFFDSTRHSKDEIFIRTAHMGVRTYLLKLCFTMTPEWKISQILWISRSYYVNPFYWYTWIQSIQRQSEASCYWWMQFGDTITYVLKTEAVALMQGYHVVFIDNVKGQKPWTIGTNIRRLTKISFFCVVFYIF